MGDFQYQAEDREQAEAERYLLMLYRGSDAELRSRIVEAVEREIAADLRGRRTGPSR